MSPGRLSSVWRRARWLLAGGILLATGVALVVARVPAHVARQAPERDAASVQLACYRGLSVEDAFFGFDPTALPVSARQLLLAAIEPVLRATYTGDLLREQEVAARAHYASPPLIPPEFAVVSIAFTDTQVNGDTAVAHADLVLTDANLGRTHRFAATFTCTVARIAGDWRISDAQSALK